MVAWFLSSREEEETVQDRPSSFASQLMSLLVLCVTVKPFRYLSRVKRGLLNGMYTVER